ncbi:MAG: ABC transporter ATP-binding protein [Flavobacteriales bacterium]|nr:ABC transporter ATP-binding protein [Flavobacteriales bacterium]
MSSDDFAIRIQGLSKCFQIYDTPRDRLKQFVAPRLQQMVGKPKKQYFREFWALNDVSFEVKKGETVGIIGRNGSGKSTLLQLICGTLTPSSGSVETRGRIAALLELGSGFNPEFTGRENVYMNAAVLGLSKEETDARFDDIAAFAEIGQFIEQPVKTYSSGMVVRLAFAVAINVDPQILIIDEALSVGDELFQRKCFSRIEAIKNNGATILFVSHSGSTVVELCDHAMLIDSGEKLSMGAPKEIVGIYQKLIYAPQDKRNAIRKEIRVTSKNRKRTESLQKFRQTKGNFAIENELDEFFDPNLKPQSTLVFESNGACIESSEIFTLSGEKVNCLRRGKSYRYTYNVRFDKGATNVRFAMLVKTISGLELGGAVSAPSLDQSIPYIAPGSIVSVEFRFTCNLNPDSYFFNAGVRGMNRDEETYLHRVIDICMFKVMPLTDNTATAFIDFNCVAKFELINNPLQEVEKA